MERFLTTMTVDGAEIAIRKMSNAQLEKCRGELTTQFGEVQAEFVDLLNRQLTLARYMAAIEFEQERRSSVGDNP